MKITITDNDINMYSGTKYLNETVLDNESDNDNYIAITYTEKERLNDDEKWKQTNEAEIVIPLNDLYDAVVSLYGARERRRMEDFK